MTAQAGRGGPVLQRVGVVARGVLVAAGNGISKMIFIIMYNLSCADYKIT